MPRHVVIAELHATAPFAAWNLNYPPVRWRCFKARWLPDAKTLIGQARLTAGKLL